MRTKKCSKFLFEVKLLSAKFVKPKMKFKFLLFGNPPIAGIGIPAAAPCWLPRTQISAAVVCTGTIC